MIDPGGRELLVELPVLADERAHGHRVVDAAALERLERENLAALDDLAKGDRVAVEA